MKKIIMPSENTIPFSNVKENEKYIIGFCIDKQKYAITRNTSTMSDSSVRTDVRVLNIIDNTELTHVAMSTKRELIESLNDKYSVEFFVFDTKRELLEWILL